MDASCARSGSAEQLGYLVAVHHVPEAGQSMDPHVHVLVLNGSHGELQRRRQIAAAGGQLRNKRDANSIKNKLSSHPQHDLTDLFVILQSCVDVFELRVIG